MEGNFLIGLDAGTTSIKGLLIDTEGNSETIIQKEYSLEYKGGDRVELHPDEYWQTSQWIINQLIVRSGINPDKIRAISFSSQGETLIVLDKNGTPLRKAIVWLDNRSVSEAKEIEYKFGKPAILDKTGQPEVLPLWPATKILWLQKNEPEIFRKIHKYLLVEDFLIYKLTGEYAAEESLVSSTLCFDIKKKVWWDKMLDFLHITSDRLPAVFPSGLKIGKVSPEAVLSTGLSTETLVITGAYDHAAGAIGAGNIAEGMVTETTGTAMAMCVTSDHPVIDLKLNLPCQCHAINGKYFLLPYGQTAGMALKWFRDVFCHEEIGEAEKTGKNVYDIITGMVCDIPAGSEGLIALPHLMGAGSPEFDVNVKGVFAGITPNMNKGHFIRAIMEAIACMVNRNIESLLNHQIQMKEIRALGGGAASDLWNQIKADMTGIPYVTVQSSEAACMGAVILAGVGSGLFSNVEEGCQKLIRLKKKYLPNPVMFDEYQKVYRKYTSLYDHLKNYW